VHQTDGVRMVHAVLQLNYATLNKRKQALLKAKCESCGICAGAFSCTYLLYNSVQF